MQRIFVNVFADYFQFYLWDPACAFETLNWTDEVVGRRLNVGWNMVAIYPVRNMTVPVEIEVHDRDPGYNPGAWDHIVECGFEIESGKVEVIGCTDGPVAQFSVPPTIYRLGAFYGDLDKLDDDGLYGDDHYMVVMWAAPWAEIVVIKQWTGK